MAFCSINPSFSLSFFLSFSSFPTSSSSSTRKKERKKERKKSIPACLLLSLKRENERITIHWISLGESSSIIIIEILYRPKLKTHLRRRASERSGGRESQSVMQTILLYQFRHTDCFDS